MPKPFDSLRSADGRIEATTRRRLGMGTYRGEAGFRTFSHARAIYRQTEAKEAVALLHPPYGDLFLKFLSAAIAG